MWYTYRVFWGYGPCFWISFYIYICSSTLHFTIKSHIYHIQLWQMLWNKLTFYFSNVAAEFHLLNHNHQKMDNFCILVYHLFRLVYFSFYGSKSRGAINTFIPMPPWTVINLSSLNLNMNIIHMGLSSTWSKVYPTSSWSMIFGHFRLSNIIQGIPKRSWWARFRVIRYRFNPLKGLLLHQFTLHVPWSWNDICFMFI